MVWTLIRKKQINALRSVRKEAECEAVLVGCETEGGQGRLIVVHPSAKDNRRWDIDKDGTITRRDRRTPA